MIPMIPFPAAKMAKNNKSWRKGHAILYTNKLVWTPEPAAETPSEQQTQQSTAADTPREDKFSPLSSQPSSPEFKFDSDESAEVDLPFQPKSADPHPEFNPKAKRSHKLARIAHFARVRGARLASPLTNALQTAANSVRGVRREQSEQGEKKIREDSLELA